MQLLMTSLMHTFNQLVSPEQITIEPTVREMGSLQDHLMSITRQAAVEVSSSSNELSVGPPPMYRKNTTSNVVGMPKKKGSRVIVWTQIASKNQAA